MRSKKARIGGQHELHASKKRRVAKKQGIVDQNDSTTLPLLPSSHSVSIRIQRGGLQSILHQL